MVKSVKPFYMLDNQRGIGSIDEGVGDFSPRSPKSCEAPGLPKSATPLGGRSARDGLALPRGIEPLFQP